MSGSHQIICVHMGQAGLQVGFAIWELLALEHGIKINGALSSQYVRCGGASSAVSFFNATHSKRPKFTPRAVLVDTESMVLDEVRQGEYRDFFYPECMVSNGEDAANLFPRGYNGVGREVIQLCLQGFRKLAESVDTVHSIMLTRSFGGGTGSGTGALFLDEIQAESLKIPVAEIVVYPAPCISTSIVEPYNAILTADKTMRHVNISLIMDNQALYDICKIKLSLCRPTYFNINHIIAQMFSSITVSMRYESVLASDFNIFQTNLVPYPRMKYPIVSYAPIMPNKGCDDIPILSTPELVNQVFQHDSFTIKCFPEYGEYMACALLFRGKECHPSEINLAVRAIKNSSSVRFVDWSPTGFKIAINRKAPVTVEDSVLATTKKSVCLMANNTCIVQVFDYLMQKFDLLYRRKSYVHWYTGEGLEEGELNEARQVLQELIIDYMECGAKVGSNNSKSA